VVLNCFGRKSQVYDSIAGITRQFGFYAIALKIMVNKTVSQLTFITLLKKVTHHLKFFLCGIASNERTETREIYGLNEKVFLTSQTDKIRFK